MLFVIHFEVAPENRDTALKRVKAWRDERPASFKTIGGPWFSVTQLEGWHVVEAEDATALGRLMHGWTDLNVNHITPVLSEGEVLKLTN
jgi:uncharacterized protein YbdZ (MbtH family)